MNKRFAKKSFNHFQLSIFIFRGNFAVAELIVVGGYALHEEEYLFTDDADVPETLLCNLEFWGWLFEVTRNPFPLMLQCRRCVHRCLGEQTVHKVDELSLPLRLRDFIVFKDISR